MFNVFLWAMVLGSAIWVYWDATNNKIGKVPGRGGFWNNSAGVWAFATFGLWIVVFPAYLIKRSSLLSIAKEAPVEPKHVREKLGVSSALALSLLTLMAVGVTSEGLPSCSDDGVEVLLGDIIMDVGDKNLISVKEIAELGFNENRNVRACEAFFLLEDGEEFEGTYSIMWVDEENFEYSVQLRVK